MSEDQPDEGGSNPTVPSSGNDEPGTGATTDTRSDDEHAPESAGVDGRSEGDSTGLSGQPDADEFEGAADWSTVDGSGNGSPGVAGSAAGSGDATAIDSETRVDATDPVARSQNDAGGAPPPARGERTGPAGGGEHAKATAGDGRAGAGNQRGPGEKYCSNCGTVISQQAVVCPECGVEQADVPQQASAQTGTGSGKDPGVAALLSGVGFFVPFAAGAGQIYNGEVAKGILFSIIQSINFGLIFLFIGWVTYPLVSIVTIYDAYKGANR
jgi:TM2 domain-containing membrane protein YozV